MLSKGSVTRNAMLASRYSPMTTMVPSARDSGMFRRGSFTSPAVNVMLFQASAEKSDPVCATQMATNSPKALAAFIPGTMSTIPRRTQRLSEVVGDRGVIPAEQQPDDDESGERAGLGGGEDVLDDAAVLQPSGVGPREQRDHQDADQLRRSTVTVRSRSRDGAAGSDSDPRRSTARARRGSARSPPRRRQSCRSESRETDVQP